MEYGKDVLKRVQAAWQSLKEDSKLSQTSAAKAMGMNQSAFSQYIRGSIPLNTDFLRKFAALSDMELEDFGISNAISDTVPSKPIKVMATLSGRKPTEKSVLVNTILEASGCYFVEVDYSDHPLERGTMLLVNPKGSITSGDNVIYFKGEGERSVFGKLELTEEGWELTERLWQGGKRYLVDSADHVYRVSSVYFPSQGGKQFR